MSTPPSVVPRQTLFDSIAHHATFHPDRAALTLCGADGADHTLSFAQLHTLAGSTARRLREAGIAAGEAVLLSPAEGQLLPACVGFLGALYAGAVPAMIPSVGAAPSREYLQRVQRLAQRAQAGAVLAAPAACGPLREWLGPACRVLSAETVTAAGAADGYPPPAAAPDSPAYLQFTSGSSGTPRAACISHSAALSNIAGLARGFAFDQGSTSVGWLPLYHDLGLVMQFLLPLVVGARAVLIPPQRWLRRPETLLQAVHRYGGSMSWMPNFAFAHCTRRIRDAELEGVELGSWRILGCGGEPIRPQNLAAFARRFAPYGLDPKALMAGYGMAENTVGVSHGPLGRGIAAERLCRRTLEQDGRAEPAGADAADAVEVVSCGVPFAGTAFEVADAEGAALPERRVGEIRIRGESLFSGYLGQPQASAAALREGWFHTGDRGYVAEGELYLVGRIKELIITAGRNVSPHEIEEAAAAAAGEAVRRVVAFGVADERLGTELAVVVAELRGRLEEHGQQALGERIRRQVADALALTLADVRLVRSGWIEVTTSGKLARADNRRKYLDAGFRPPAMEPATAEDLSPEALRAELCRIIATACGRAEVPADAGLAELGLDSLALVQLAAAIEERLGRQVPMEQLALGMSVEGLVRQLSGSGEPAPTVPPREDAELYPVSGVVPGSPLRLRLLRRGPVLRGRAVPYAPGNRALRALVAGRLLRRRLYDPEIALIKRCIERVPVRLDAESVLRQSLMANSWIDWRYTALDGPQAAAWLTLRGGEVLDALAAQGRGVVLVLPHVAMKRLVRRLPRFADRPPMVVGHQGSAALAAQGLPQVARALERGERLSRTAVRSTQLDLALRALREGGLALVFGDEDEGSGGIELDFHGCRRPFRPGAAELALRTGAAFVPLFATMALSGEVSFECLPPLHPEGDDHGQRVESLLRQYAALLEQRYTTDLGAMEWYILRKFLNYPLSV